MFVKFFKLLFLVVLVLPCSVWAASLNLLPPRLDISTSKPGCPKAQLNLLNADLSGMGSTLASDGKTTATIKCNDGYALSVVHSDGTSEVCKNSSGSSFNQFNVKCNLDAVTKVGLFQFMGLSSSINCTSTSDIPVCTKTCTAQTVFDNYNLCAITGGQIMSCPMANSAVVKNTSLTVTNTYAAGLSYNSAAVTDGKMMFLPGNTLTVTCPKVGSVQYGLQETGGISFTTQCNSGKYVETGKSSNSDLYSCVSKYNKCSMNFDSANGVAKFVSGSSGISDVGSVYQLVGNSEAPIGTGTNNVLNGTLLYASCKYCVKVSSTTYYKIAYPFVCNNASWSLDDSKVNCPKNADDLITANYQGVSGVVMSRCD